MSLPPLSCPLLKNNLANYWAPVKTEHPSLPTWFFDCGVGQNDAWCKGPSRPHRSGGLGVFKNAAGLAPEASGIYMKRWQLYRENFIPHSAAWNKGTGSVCLWFIKVTWGVVVVVRNTFKLLLGDSPKCLPPLALIDWPNWTRGGQWAAMAAPSERQVCRTGNECGWPGPRQKSNPFSAPANTLLVEPCYFFYWLLCCC